MQPKVSVIIPAYNAEKTLKRCLDSVFAQDFDSYEVILVNDGSTDGTLEIARFYEKHPNFVFIHQPNWGVSEARWAGISASRSEYLAFVDADDFIAPGMIKKMFLKAQETGAEIVICGVNRVDEGERVYRRYKKGSETGLSATEKVMTGVINGSLWNKLFLKSLLWEEDHLRTVDIQYGEDQLLLAPAVARADKVAYLEEILYFYVQNPVSATNIPKVSALADLFKVRSFLFEFYKSPRFSEWNHLAPYYYAIGLIDILRILNRAEKQQEVRDLRADIHSKLYGIASSEIWRAKRSGVFFDILLLRAGLFETFYSLWESDLFRYVRELRRKLFQKT